MVRFTGYDSNLLYWATIPAFGKDCRKQLKGFAGVIAGTFYSTDGKRLHMVKVPGLPNGFYEVVRRTKTEIILDNSNTSIPDFRMLTSNQPVAMGRFEGFNDGDHTHCSLNLVWLIKRGILVNYTYFHEACAGEAYWEVFVHNNSVVEFKGATKTVLIARIAMEGA